MEFNAFQMMNQTHEHECHLLTQQLNSKNTRTTREQWKLVRKLKESKNKTILETQHKAIELIELNKNTNYRIEMKNKHN